MSSVEQSVVTATPSLQRAGYYLNIHALITIRNSHGLSANANEDHINRECIKNQPKM